MVASEAQDVSREVAPTSSGEARAAAIAGAAAGAAGAGNAKGKGVAMDTEDTSTPQVMNDGR